MDTTYWEQFLPIPAGGHRLPPLPYDYDALEPIISEGTLRIHHDKHHLGYVEGLNKAELKLKEARAAENFDLIRHWERELAFNGSGHILHSIFWTLMKSPTKIEPVGELTAEQINYYFGSYNVFKEQFSKAAITVEGSGWGVLIWNPAWGRLEILAAENHQNSTQWGGIPILVVDVWEHAYYLDYQNKRAEFVENWWKLVNWKVVEMRLKLAMEGKMPLMLY
ncbi:MAG: superoxide dismutase [Firmicutes bacterium]|nr:superoxide dismutase [Bacillota bacterium]